MRSKITRTWRGIAAAGLSLAALTGIGLAVASHSSSDVGVTSAAGKISDFENNLLHDPASPVAGNPAGTATVVEFFDYRCPYCRIMEPRIQTLIEQDKSVRLVLKDWPIFGGMSVYAAQVAIASGWQGKYLPVHDALFALPRTIDRGGVRAVARKAGVNLVRLDRDLSERSAEMDQILGRTDVEARTLQLQGTPGFVIGHSLVPGALSLDDLEQLVAKAKAVK